MGSEWREEKDGVRMVGKERWGKNGGKRKMG